MITDHEHSKHPTFLFEVEVEFIGKNKEDYFQMQDGFGNVIPCPKELLKSLTHPVHALIYTDGSIAVTLYECTYAYWFVHNGKCQGGSLYSDKHNWKLSDAAISSITEYASKNNYQIILTKHY